MHVAGGSLFGRGARGFVGPDPRSKREEERMLEWTVVRIRGERGLPGIDGAEFLGCIGAIRGELGDSRWHFRWVPDPAGRYRDGLRVERPFGSDEVARVVQALEEKIPPPDAVFAEPLRTETDLDPIPSADEMEDCLELLWRYSVFLADLRARNPALTASGIRDLTPGALLTFVTGDRRHLERALDEQAVASVPAVSFGSLIGLVRLAGLKYAIPPGDQAEAAATARIHHLAACTFASRYYPFRRAR